MANLVKKCKDIPGQELFQYYDDNNQRHTIGSGDINSYIKKITGEDFTAKDFRAWSGSINALCAFLDIGEFTSETDCKHKIINVLDSVAQKLGNTRTVCKKYYVHPTVIAAYEKGSIWNYKPDQADDGELNSNEKALLKLLTTEDIAEVIA